MGPTTTSSLCLRVRILLQKTTLRNTLVMDGEWLFSKAVLAILDDDSVLTGTLDTILRI